MGAQIAQTQIQAHLSQKDLGLRSKVLQPEISHIERGAGNPTGETLNKLATALNARFVLVPLAADKLGPGQQNAVSPGENRGAAGVSGLLLALINFHCAPEGRGSVTVGTRVNPIVSAGW